MQSAAAGVSRRRPVYKHQLLFSHRVFLLGKHSFSTLCGSLHCVLTSVVSVIFIVLLRALYLYFFSCLKTTPNVAFSILRRIQLGLFLFTLPGAHRDVESAG